jgi:hypothetical protein
VAPCCAGHPPILHNAEIAVILAVFLTIGAAQKTSEAAECRNRAGRKEGRSSPKGF